LIVENLTDAERERLGIDAGVRVTSAVGAAAEAGMREGDVITKLDNRDVTNADEYADIAGDLQPGRSVAVLVIRGQNPLFLPLRVPD
jgi:serine protease Do